MKGELRLVPVDKLVRPANPMRDATLMEGIDDLCEDLAQNGQLQEIGVEEQPNGDLEIIWGDRRGIAFTMLGWKECIARVFPKGSVDKTLLMLAENNQREQANPVETARMYKRLRDENNISVSEVARRVRKAPSTVSRVLSLLEGDARVLEAVEQGLINPSQASQINLYKDEMGRAQALNLACRQGWNTDMLRIHREQREAYGIDVTSDATLEVIKNLPKIDVRTHAKCHLCDEWGEYGDVNYRALHESCWAKVQEIIAFYAAKAQRAEAAQEARESDGATPTPPAASSGSIFGEYLDD